MARKKSKSRKKTRRNRRKGMGSVVTVRRARGKGMSGFGGPMMDAVLPPVVGGGSAAVTTLLLRKFVDPMAGNMQLQLVKWAPFAGMAVGSLASGLMWFFGGRDTASAMSSLAAATAVTLFGTAQDHLIFTQPEGVNLALALSPGAAANGAASTDGSGVSAILPQYGSPGMDGIVMEQLSGGHSHRGVGSYGEVVSLNGINVGAFGTPGFNA